MLDGRNSQSRIQNRVSSVRLQSTVARSLESSIFPVPDADPDQRPAGDLRSGRAADGPDDPDAASQERRAWRGIWWRRDRKYFRRSNHQRAGQIHILADRIFLRSDLCLVNPVFAQDEPRHGIAERIVEATNNRSTNCIGSTGKSERAGDSRSGRSSLAGGKRSAFGFGDGNCTGCSIRVAENVSKAELKTVAPLIFLFSRVLRVYAIVTLSPSDRNNRFLACRRREESGGGHGAQLAIQPCGKCRNSKGEKC
jgi:hypothetical protein